MKFTLYRLTENWSRNASECSQVLNYLHREEQKKFNAKSELNVYESMLLVVHDMLSEQFRGRSCLDMTLLWMCEQLMPFCMKLADQMEVHIEAVITSHDVEPINISTIVIADGKYVTHTGHNAFYVFDGWQSIEKLTRTPSEIAQLMPEIKFIESAASFFGPGDRGEFLRPMERIPDVITDPATVG